jgi:hypothetical protein
MKTIRITPKIREDLRARVAMAGECWEWTGTRNRQGYGTVHIGDGLGPYLAHRVSFTAFVGQIPDDLVIDHLCRNPPCINPAHMEPVTRRVNSLRGESPTAVAVRTGTCKRGHEFQPGKPCAACCSIRNRAARLAREAANPALREARIQQLRRNYRARAAEAEKVAAG